MLLAKPILLITLFLSSQSAFAVCLANDAATYCSKDGDGHGDTCYFGEVEQDDVTNDFVIDVEHVAGENPNGDAPGDIVNVLFGEPRQPQIGVRGEGIVCAFEGVLVFAEAYEDGKMRLGQVAISPQDATLALAGETSCEDAFFDENYSCISSANNCSSNRVSMKKTWALALIALLGFFTRRRRQPAS